MRPLHCADPWNWRGALTTMKPLQSACGFFFLLLRLHCSTVFTVALVRSPHCFASRFSPGAAKFLTRRKNKGLKKPGKTVKNLYNNFSKSQALGTAYKRQHRHFPPPWHALRNTREVDVRACDCQRVHLPLVFRSHRGASHI